MKLGFWFVCDACRCCLSFAVKNNTTRRVVLHDNGTIIRLHFPCCFVSVSSLTLIGLLFVALCNSEPFFLFRRRETKEFRHLGMSSNGFVFQLLCKHTFQQNHNTFQQHQVVALLTTGY